MDVIINGNERELSEEINTVSKLIRHLEITNPVIIVEHNDVILQKVDHEKTVIKAGDQIELIQFVGGG